jgi:tetratricopeptide (TPR) repeat protein
VPLERPRRRFRAGSSPSVNDPTGCASAVGLVLLEFSASEQLGVRSGHPARWVARTRGVMWTPRVPVPGAAALAVVLASALLLSACIGGGAAPAGPSVSTQGDTGPVRTAVPAPTAAAVSTLAPAPPPTSDRLPSVTPAVRPTTPPTQALVEFFAGRVAEDPDDGEAQLQLGLALLQRIRETADPSLYPSAEAAFDAARRLRPEDPLPLVGLGGILLGKHEFADALRVGRTAAALDPPSSGAGAVVVDALIELGRYDAASEAIDRLVSGSADLTSLARLSYVRELHGDLSGALAAMQRAAAAPGLAPENTAFALALVGQLEQQSGHRDLAFEAYDHALRLVPQHAPSLAGLGRLAVATGDLDAAQDDFARAVEILPSPEYVIALGETLEAAGNTTDARKQYDLARAQIALLQAGGVVVDLDLALFEADHGDAARALVLAEAAYAATPTVRAADGLGWALHRAGRDDEAWERAAEALRLGSRDPRFHYHAGAIALARGDDAAARQHLEQALRTDPGFSATDAIEVRRLLARIGS